MSESQPWREGLILKKIPYGEADEIVTVLFREGGVRRLFVPGSRKSIKRFAGLIDLFAHLKFQCWLGRGSLWRLQAAEEICDGKRYWESDLRAYAFFCYFAELICEFTPEELGAADLYGIWNEAATFCREGKFSMTMAADCLIRIFTCFGYGGLSRELNEPRGTYPDPEQEATALLKRIVTFSHQILQKRTRSEAFLLQMIATG